MDKDLQEAIAYAKKKAEELTIKSNELYEENYEESSKCQECTNKYEQFTALFTELQERRELDRWIPISEKLPNKEGRCLVFTDYGDVTMDSFVDRIFICNLGNVTHWKPLPKAPKSEA